MKWRMLMRVFLGIALSLLILDIQSFSVSMEKVSEPGSIKKPEEKPYTTLVEKNIFSPERKEFPFFTPSPTPGSIPKPQIRPQVILSGITLAGEYQAATIVQIGKSVGKGERETLILRPGERIGEYKLTKILPDRIVLEAEGDQFEVLLYDPTKPKTRKIVRTESKPTTVTTGLPGPSPIPASQPPSSVPVTPPMEKRESTMPITSSPVPGSERMVTTPMPTPIPQFPTPSAPPTYSPRRRVPLPATPTTTPQSHPNEPGGP